MLKQLHVLLLLSAVTLLSACESKKEKLRQNIISAFETQKGTFAIAFSDLSSGDELFVNEHETFHAASTMKTPVLIELYKQVAEGKFSLSDSIEIKTEFKSIVDGSPYQLNAADDSEQELYKMVGQKATLSELAYKMIIVSSNLATNLIIEKVGAENVTQTMRSLGAQDMLVLRGVEDSKAFAKGLNNFTTAFDLMTIFKQMALGKTVNDQSSQAMIGILMDQTFSSIIPAKLPKDVKVAHKTGWINGQHHDSGIVFLPDGRKYVLVLLSKGFTDEKAATEMMATVSEMVYHYVTE